MMHTPKVLLNVWESNANSMRWLSKEFVYIIFKKTQQVCYLRPCIDYGCLQILLLTITGWSWFYLPHLSINLWKFLPSGTDNTDYLTSGDIFLIFILAKKKRRSLAHTIGACIGHCFSLLMTIFFLNGKSNGKSVRNCSENELRTNRAALQKLKLIL